MKKRVWVGILISVLLGISSFIIPVRKEKEWVNDDDIDDIGHYETSYYNIYGGNITIFKILLKSKK